MQQKQTYKTKNANLPKAVLNKIQHCVIKINLLTISYYGISCNNYTDCHFFFFVLSTLKFYQHIKDNCSISEAVHACIELPF